jgi:hypothetical protein
MHDVVFLKIGYILLLKSSREIYPVQKGRNRGVGYAYLHL